ncbi:MAG: aquaporin, partial [Alphaproteobacteria bacterium]|nr:aquaporin [Alphaproteobacteria bacterium]
MCKLCALVPPKYSAEFIGSMFFTLIGCGVIITAIDDIGFIGVAAVLGMTYIALYQVIASVSGGYINPVFTLGGMMDKRLKLDEGLLYMLFQVLGAVLGALILWACLRSMG